MVLHLKDLEEHPGLVQRQVRMSGKMTQGSYCYLADAYSISSIVSQLFPISRFHICDEKKKLK